MAAYMIGVKLSDWIYLGIYSCIRIQRYDFGPELNSHKRYKSLFRSKKDPYAGCFF